MSSLAFLVTELQSLASETRRKHPEVREAAEKSLAILRASPEQATLSLSADGPQSDDLLRPVFMGCATKNAKVVAISLGSLTRLISLKAVPMSAVPLIVTTMGDCMSQGVDIQLRILQTLLSLITNFPAIHGELLGDALLLCFKLQESRIAVVSSTAAATLRQLVMFVVDKVVDEDRQANEPQPNQLTPTTLPDGTQKLLGPSACDAFAVFEDLCLLANGENPGFLKLDWLHKTFALELIESVMTNYHELFRKRSELLLLLRHHLCPLLLKSLSEHPVFPLTLRSTRVVFLLVKQFLAELGTEAEVFLMLLIKIIGGESDGHSGDHVTPRPQWMRVLAMEIMRGLCNDADLMRSIHTLYDTSHPSSPIFSSLITSLKRLLTEKPHLLGSSAQMGGVGVVGAQMSEATSTSGFESVGGGVVGMAGIVANAAVSGVVGMMGSEVGLSLGRSAMKLQCIDQLDKADAPPIPESYIYLLGMQCIASICEGFASFAGPVYNSIMVQRPRAAGDAAVRAPPSLEISTLPSDEPITKQLKTVYAMVEDGWPALLAALSFIISTNLSDELFVDVLASYQAMTNVSGMLGLTTPRDAFVTSLSKFAIPSRVVSSLDQSYMEPSTPRTATTAFSENLGLSGPVQPPGLSERNLACLKVLVSSALFLAGSLGEGWFGVLEALQNADYVLTFKGTKVGRGGSVGPGLRSVSTGLPAPSASGGPQQLQQTAPRHPLLSDLDAESVLSAIQRLFDASKNLDDGAFKNFVEALCKLSGEMVGMQTQVPSVVGGGDAKESSEDVSSPGGSLLAPVDAAHRRRVSGIHLPPSRTLRSGDFGINKLGGVALSNIHRLVYRSPDVAWDTITVHLLSVILLPLAPQSIRIQAARTLDDILIVIPRNLSSPGELQGKVQRRVLDVLAQQVMSDHAVGIPGSNINSEIKRMGLETLHQILLASGHTLVVGWETIFQMLGSVCKPAFPSSPANSSASLTTTRPKPPPLGYTTEKNYTANIKVAFQSLTLVCEMLSLLSPEHLRLCITTLGQFGRQADTNIALTAAESLLWGVSDSIQSKRKDSEKEPEYSALWMSLLLEVLGLCTDARPEVRVGAIQTLFRSIQLYGATLSLETWDECIWKVTFPLLDSITAAMRRNLGSPSLGGTTEMSPPSDQEWDESKVLALQSIGNIFHDFLALKIIYLDSFSKAWDVFVMHIQDSVLFDSRTTNAPALRCLEKAIAASAGVVPEQKERVLESWERVWQACDEIGGAVLKRGGPHYAQSGLKPFTQESLVAFVDVIRSTRTVRLSLEGQEWPLERLGRLMAILKGVLTYQNSPDYRPDIDGLTPVQAVVIETVSTISLSGSGVPSLVLRDLSEYVTLPFVAAFDVQAPVPMVPSSSSLVSDSIKRSTSSQIQKRITYIALAKKCMPMLVDLYTKFQDNQEIYADGTLEVVISGYSIPIKLKYECPAPSKFGKDPPLWKTATTSFLKIVKGCGEQIKSFKNNIPDERVEGIWRHVLDVFRGGILADCSSIESLSLEAQEAEENFDLSLVASLEIDVIPHLGDPRVPDYLVIQLAKVVAQGSKIVEYRLPIGFSGGSGADSTGDVKVAPKQAKGKKSVQGNGVLDEDRNYALGTTEQSSTVPRERFSYWCLDLLFLICSDTAKDGEASRRRVAALSLSSLLSRCRMSLLSYVADEGLRGGMPFPRTREEELLYILRKLHELTLWPGSLWAALSDSPSNFCVEQSPIDSSLPPSALIADAVRRSPKAHLFHFYDVLCEIAAAPRPVPKAWVAIKQKDRSGRSSGDEDVEEVRELDARSLAKDCLKEIGREMGVGR